MTISAIIFSGFMSAKSGEGLVFGVLILPGALVALFSVIGYLFTFMAAETIAFGTPRQALEYSALGFFGGLTAVALGIVMRSKKY